MKSFPFHIFRKYDIRGVYGTEVTEEISFRTAKAFAALCRDLGRQVESSAPGA